jgi:hypothetical protein
MKPKLSIYQLIILACSTTALSCTYSKAPLKSESIPHNKQLIFNLPPAPYDSGPEHNSAFAAAFAEADLINKIAQTIGQRNIFGPAAYRGRLGSNQAKVIVLGNDNLSANFTQRAFTGIAGRELQYFLNTIGVDQSYVFLNSTPFTSANNNGLALEKYRNQLLTTAALNNQQSLALIIAVGPDGKKMLSDWITGNDGICKTTQNLAQCSPLKIEQKFKLFKRLQIIGIPQPSLFADQQIDASFQRALESVLLKTQTDPTWLPADNNTLRAKTRARYSRRFADLPPEDFPFGTDLKLLKQSNAHFKQLSLSSIEVTHTGRPNRTPYPPLIGQAVYDLNNPIPEKKPSELADFWPLQLPQSKNQTYDQGPCPIGAKTCAWSELLRSQDLLYRGRLENARVLVIADPSSGDDYFSRRAQTGDLGQKLQTFLNAMGIDDSYAIINSFPLDQLTFSESERINFLIEPHSARIRWALYDKIVRNSQPEIVLTVGPISKQIWTALNFKTIAYNLESTLESNHIELWNQLLHKLSKRSYRRDATPTYSYNGHNTNVPRKDLPFHTPWWIGTSGNRTSLKVNDHKLQVQLIAPHWLKDRQ